MSRATRPRLGRGFGGRDAPTTRAAAMLLALPYLVTITATRGLTRTLHTFHDGDETVYHYPTVVRFAHQLPGVDLVHYRAAQSPLFHLMLAGVAKLGGLELWRLRLVEALISYVAALVLFGLLRDRRGLEPRAALALTVVVVLSPYVFAESFILITDNLALLFVLLALDRLERFRVGAGSGQFALAAAAAGAAVLTRQSTAFVFVVAVGYLIIAWRGGGRRRRELLGGLVALGLAVLPMALLVLAWGGLVPIGSDSSSCGLCPRGANRVDQAGSGLFLRSMIFTLAITAVYAVVLFGPAALRRLRDNMGRGDRFGLGGAVLLGLVAALVLAVDPVRSQAVNGRSPSGDAGWLWRMSEHAPVVGASSALFWLLVPIGAGALWLRLHSARRDPLPTLFFGSFGLVVLSTRLGYQKYYDPFALLTLVLSVRPGELRRVHYMGAGLLVVGGLVYALSFVV